MGWRKALHRETYLAGYRERVRALVESSRAGGAMPVLMTQPALYGPGRDPKTGVDLTRVLVQDDLRMGGRDVGGGLAWRILELIQRCRAGRSAATTISFT